MNKHESGDVVKIRSWRSMENEYGVNICGEIGIYPFFIKEMSDLCGETITLERPPTWVGNYLYKGFTLCDWMFEE